MLNRRQRTLYKHLCDIWSMTRTVNPVTAKPGGETFTRISINTPCIYEYTPNVDVETAAGRVKEFTLLTTDKIHMEAAVVIKDGYVTVNRTILADGSHSHAFNDVHRVLGQPMFHDTIGRRKANKLMVEAMTMEHAPAAIVAFYGLRP